MAINTNQVQKNERTQSVLNFETKAVSQAYLSLS